LKKSELIEKLNEYKPSILPPFLVELMQTVSKDMSRKVCKQCGELNHGISSSECKVNIQKSEVLKYKIKKYFLSKESEKDEPFESISHQLNISTTQCKLLYKEIPLIDLLERPISKELLQDVPFTTCNECNKTICTIRYDTVRTWKGKKICDGCFSKYSDERDQTWMLIEKYKPIQCALCFSKKNHKDERYQFDHFNMFDKETTIYKMVIEGIDINDIYKEIDKCQVLCISCHHIVTHIECKLGFTKLKKTYSSYKLKQPEYETENGLFQKHYEEKMNHVYELTRQKFM
jgi:hypothetical protein